ncbi:hypothetical protein C7378_0293 [Acidipila rosea]|uniref:Uncharacterized protein n=1 Tax=Acidipila rosea TaxID=768535 RepID=A0A4R1LCX4_9BACT|nr:hypothetical protein C7378_0293 [Acidipila rosea]
MMVARQRRPVLEPVLRRMCSLLRPARMIPKIHVLLDILGDYIGTDRNPRLRQQGEKGFFTDPGLAPTHLDFNH